MKKNLLTILLATCCFLSSFQSYAGGSCVACTPVTTGCTGPFGAVCPDNLPDATVGTQFDENLTVFIPSTVDTVLPVVGALTIPVNFAVYLGVTGLPDGLVASDFVADSLGTCTNILVPDSLVPNSNFTCIRIFGNPCGGTQTINATVDFLLDVTTPFGDFQVPQSFPVVFELISTVPVLELTSTLDYLCPSGNPDGGDVTTISAQAGFDTYEWSTSETTQSIDVSDAGVVSLTVTHPGCTQVAEVEIFDLIADVETATFDICANQIVQFLGSGGTSFTWTPATNLSDANSDSPVLFDLTSSATYNLEVSNGFCEDNIDVEVNVVSCTTDCNPATPDRNFVAPLGSIAAVTPTSVGNMTAGVNFETDVTFFLQASVPLEDLLAAALGTSLPGLPAINIAPEQVTISDVLDLPDGLSWTCDQHGNNCDYFPALYPDVTQFGSISICGVPCAPAGQDSFTIVATFTATLPDAVPFLGGSTQDFDATLRVAYNVLVTNPLTIAANPNTPSIPVGTPVTLTASTNGFTNFLWSTTETTSSIVVNSGSIFTVSAFDGNCTQSASITVDFVTGIEDLDATTFNIFPNPSNGVFSIDFDLKKSVDVRLAVYDVQGKEMLQQNLDVRAGKNAQLIDMSNAAPGIYIVKLFVDGGAITRRITKF